MKMYEVTRFIYALDAAEAMIATGGEVTGLHYKGESRFSEPATTAVDQATEAQILASITDEYLISFEDGKKYKTLKRSLSKLGMTPADYREKWGLPDEYPTTCPSYSARRSALAKANGLGRKP
jgi:predicted transcriptional regulator